MHVLGGVACPTRRRRSEWDVDKEEIEEVEEKERESWEEEEELQVEIREEWGEVVICVALRREAQGDELSNIVI